MTDTKIHPETGKTLTRHTRKEIVSFGPFKREVEIHGWYPDDGSDSLHSGADLMAANEAFKSMRAAYGDHVRKIRKRLKLSQERAGKLIGGGKRAFQKYESGTLVPSDAAMGLLEVLYVQPDVVKVLEELRAEGTMKMIAQSKTLQMQTSPKKRMKTSTDKVRTSRRSVAA